MVDLGEHSLANGEVVAYGVLNKGEGEGEVTAITQLILLASILVH